MVSDMDAMFSCIFYLCDVRMRPAITCIGPRGYLRGHFFKKKSVSGGSFIREKSVKEELDDLQNKLTPICTIVFARWWNIFS